MTAFRLDRPINAAWRPSLAPWRGQVIDLNAPAGEMIEVPNELTFALAKDLEDWGYPVTWIDRPTPDEVERQRELALAQGHYIGPSITLTRHLFPAPVEPSRLEGDPVTLVGPVDVTALPSAEGAAAPPSEAPVRGRQRKASTPRSGVRGRSRPQVK